MTRQHRALGVTLAVALSLVLVRCGGGGVTAPSSSVIPDPNPAPTPAPPPAPPPIPTVSMSGLSPETQAYLRASNIDYWGNGRVTRFPVGVPIRIYSDRFPQALEESTRLWEEISSRGATFQIVGTVEEAQIKLTHEYPNRYGELGLGSCGRAGPDVITNNVIVSAIGLFAFGLKPDCMYGEGDWQVRVAIAHEIGHALGLLTHTPFPGHDLMASPNSTSMVVTPMLREAITWLYSPSVPPGAKVE